MPQPQDLQRSIHPLRTNASYKNVNMPPPPQPQDLQRSIHCVQRHLSRTVPCPSSFDLRTSEIEFLTPHFRKRHFSNLQPFHRIVNGTCQNRQPFQRRRISRMPKTTLASRVTILPKKKPGLQVLHTNRNLTRAFRIYITWTRNKHEKSKGKEVRYLPALPCCCNVSH